MAGAALRAPLDGGGGGGGGGGDTLGSGGGGGGSGTPGLAVDGSGGGGGGGGGGCGVESECGDGRAARVVRGVRGDGEDDVEATGGTAASTTETLGEQTAGDEGAAGD
jgi:hypothetical protein